MGSGVSTSDAEALAKVKADLIVAEAEAAWLLQVVEKLKSHSYLLKLWQKCNFKNLSYITLKQVQHLILFNKLWAFPRLKDARCLRCFFTQHCNSGSAAPASGISDSRRPSFSTLRSDAHWLRLGFSKLRVQWPCFPMLIRDIVIHGVLLRRQRNEYKRLATGQHGKAAAQMSKDSLKQFLNLLNIAPASQFKVFEQLATLAETGSGDGKFSEVKAQMTMVIAEHIVPTKFMALMWGKDMNVTQQGNGLYRAGSFCITSKTTARKILTASQIIYFEDLFNMFDIDDNHSIDEDEFEMVLIRLGEDKSREEIQKLIAKYDTDG